MNPYLEPNDAPPEDPGPDEEYEPDYDPDDYYDPHEDERAIDRYERGIFGDD